jgi:uncharacterized protein YbjQ (UPF0145 family)
MARAGTPAPGSEPQESQAAEAEQAESLRRIEAGGIPVSAERRLRELREGKRGGSFTSDLSISGFALARKLGLTPISQVMGSSIYQMGYQGAWGQQGSLGQLGYGSTFMLELETLSRALNEVRTRALGRLAEEALHVGADAVVEVDTRAGETSLETGTVSLEHTVLGTAVRRSGAAGTASRSSALGQPGARPVLSELSVADFAKLVQAGFEPLGIVAWSSVFFASYSFGPGLSGGGMAMGGMQNFELREFTQAFYNAREAVMARLSEQATALGATGIVGVRIGHTARRHELGAGWGPGGGSRTGLMVTFNAIGTAIHQRVKAAAQAPKTILDLSAAADE